MPGASALVERFRSQHIPAPGEVLIDGGVTWDGDTLVVSEQVMEDRRLRRRNFSASVSNAMENCHASWAAGQLIDSPVDPFLARDAGSFVHDIFEHMFQVAPEERTRDFYRERRDQFARKLFDDPETADRWAAWLDSIALGLWDVEDPQTVDVFATERGVFGLPVTDWQVPLVGFLDRVSVTGRQGETVRVSIDDYKTGKWTPEWKLAKYGDHYGEQLRLYAIALQTVVARRDEGWFRQQYGAERDRWMWEIAGVDRARLLFTAAGRAREVDLSAEALEETGATFARHWEDFSRMTAEGRFDVRTGPLCGWCPLVSVCPAARLEGRRASERAPEQHTPGQFPTLASAITQGSAAHSDHVTEMKEHDMTDGPHPVERHLHEGKPWDERAGDDLNIGSYAAMATFAITNRAMATLKAAIPGKPVKGRQVRALVSLLAGIVSDAERHLTGRFDWQSSANARVRGLLFTVMETTPIPVGGDADAWRAWADKVLRNVISLADLGVWLWDQGDGALEVDFDALAALPAPGPFDQVAA